MINSFTIKNFKSLNDVKIDLGKITILTGANNSGKSSFIYSLLAFKNTMSNPNQSIDACLTLPFINLGGFKETVFLKDEEKSMSFQLSFSDGEFETNLNLTIGKIISKIAIHGIKPIKFYEEIEIAFPYPGNKDKHIQIDIFEKIFANLDWNGILAKNIQVHSTKMIDNPLDQSEIARVSLYSEQLSKAFILPLAQLAKIDFVPLRRGFTHPYYNPVPLNNSITTEEEIASLLGNDRDLAGKVAFYLEKVVHRSFSVYSPPGLPTIFLQTRDKENGFTSDLVNEGLGTNQLVTIFAKILQKQNKFICIDEPEIHLHPSIIDNLVSVLVEMAEHEEKQFLISTHSEHFVNSLLKNVTKQNSKANDIKIYYLKKNRKETEVEYQKVNPNGQIEGGLKNFYETELDSLKSFFKIP